MMNKSLDTQPYPILTFGLGGDVYALPIDDVLEVAAMVELTSLPDAPPEVLGIADRHGVIFPVIDLHSVLQHNAASVSPSTLFIVAGQADNYVGLVVDEVFQVEYIQQSDRREVSMTGKYIRGIINYNGRLVQILSLSALRATFQAEIEAEDKG